MRWRSKPNRLNAGKRGRYLPLSGFDRCKRWMLVLFVIGGFGAIAWKGIALVRGEHWLMVRDILIEGELHEIDPNHLVALLGLTRKESLLLVDLEALRKRLERHPWVASVRLERRFPHTLVVQVVEHRPIAIAATGRYYYINARGQLFKLVEKGENMDFPLLVLPAKTENSVFSGIPKKTLNEMIDFLDKYDQTRFAKEYGVSEVLWRQGGLTFFTATGGLQVEVGAAEIEDQLWKLDRYYPTLMVEHGTLGFLDLQLRGKIIANAKM